MQPNTGLVNLYSSWESTYLSSYCNQYSLFIYQICSTGPSCYVEPRDACIRMASLCLKFTIVILRLVPILKVIYHIVFQT